MKIAVLVKRVPDTAATLQIAADNRSIVEEGVKFVMSPYDEHAMEEAIQLKESDGAEVIVVSLGPAAEKDAVRSGLALGADWALMVTGEGVEGLSCRGTARALAEAVKTLSPDLILAGKQAVDDDESQVPERVAELLDLPHASVVTRLELSGSTASVDSEIEGGHYTFEVPMPAVLSAEKALNTPRYPTLPNIMKAKRKEIKEVSLADLGLSADDVASEFTVESLALPRQERLGKILDGEPAEQVQLLVKALREEEKVL